jgi:hypothetical protein
VPTATVLCDPSTMTQGETHAVPHPRPDRHQGQPPALQRQDLRRRPVSERAAA